MKLKKVFVCLSVIATAVFLVINSITFERMIPHYQYNAIDIMV